MLNHSIEHSDGTFNNVYINFPPESQNDKNYRKIKKVLKKILYTTICWNFKKSLVLEAWLSLF